MGLSWVPNPVIPEGCSVASMVLLSSLTGPAPPCPVSLASLSAQAGQIPWPGFKSTQANRPQTGLTLNYPHEWRANPIFISTQLCNALCDLLRTDLPDCFCSAWVNRFSISICPWTGGGACTPVTFWGGREVSLGRRI